MLFGQGHPRHYIESNFQIFSSSKSIFSGLFLNIGRRQSEQSGKTIDFQKICRYFF